MERPYYAVTHTVRASKGKTFKGSQFHEFETQEKMEQFVKNTTKMVVEFGKKAGY